MWTLVITAGLGLGNTGSPPARSVSQLQVSMWKIFTNLPSLRTHFHVQRGRAGHGHGGLRLRARGLRLAAGLLDPGPRSRGPDHFESVD